VLNLKTAEAIGITFAEALLATIDEAIRRRQSEAWQTMSSSVTGRAGL
jgi:hypothetical protein